MRFAGVLAVTTFLALGVLSMRRSEVFTDPERLWREAMQNVPANPRAADNLASVIIQKDSSRHEEATALLREALARDSMSGYALYKLGVLALNQNQLDSARRYFDRALSINPRHPEALAELGRVYLRQGDTVAAMDRLTQSVSISANDTVLVELGQLHEAAGRGAEALASYRRALELNPRRTDVARFVAAALIESNRASDAIPVLERVVRSAGAEAIDAALLAVAYATDGRATAAAAAAATVAQSGSTDSEAYLLAGRALIAISDAQSAELLLTRAATLSKTPAEALTVLAVAKLTLGKRADAVATLRRALAADPGYAPARAALERLR
jgi:tetratricopeptide (TPR) repeat protein